MPGTSRFWTYASGVAEPGAAGLPAYPRPRRAGDLPAAGLLPAVWWKQATALARVPLQLPMIAATWRTWRGSTD